MKNHLIEAKEKGYQGDSNTEAMCWIEATNKGLDMSKEARYDRAKKMGFDINNVYYHGTSNYFDRFDKKTIGKNYTYSENSGFFFTKKLLSAKNYARLHTGNKNDGRVISVFLRFECPYEETTNSDYYSPPDRFDISSDNILREVNINKQDAIIIRGTKNDDMCIVFDPSQILSIHAAFDPETENYKKEINIEEKLEDMFWVLNFEDKNWLKEFSNLISDYTKQEIYNKQEKEIKKEIYNVIEFFELKEEEMLKKIVNENILKNKKTKKQINKIKIG